MSKRFRFTVPSVDTALTVLVCSVLAVVGMLTVVSGSVQALLA